MADGGRLARWRSAVSVTVAARARRRRMGGAAGHGLAGAQADVDVDEARTNLAEYVAENPPLPPGSAVPSEGAPCPLATPEQVADAVGDIPVSVAPWYSFTAIDSQLQSDVGDRVAVVRCVASPPTAGEVGFGLFALDIGPFDEVGLDFDRVARRFGVGRAAWVEPPDIGGDFVGLCFAGDLARQTCVLLWHRDGLVIGLEFSFRRTSTTTSRPFPELGRRHHRRTRPRRSRNADRGASDDDDDIDDNVHVDVDHLDDVHHVNVDDGAGDDRARNDVDYVDDDHETSTTTTTTEPPTTTTTDDDEPPTTTTTTTTSRRRPRPRRRAADDDDDHDDDADDDDDHDDGAADDDDDRRRSRRRRRRPRRRRPTTTTTTTVPPTTTTTTTTTTEPPTTTTTEPPTTTTTTRRTTRRRRPPRRRPPTSTTTTTTTIPLTPLWDFIEDEDDLTEFAEAVEDAGLVALFDGSAPAAEVLSSVLPQPLPQPVLDLLATEGITVLAPTNEAIAALPMWNDIVADEAALQHFVLVHVLPGQLDEGEIFAMAAGDGVERRCADGRPGDADDQRRPSRRPRPARHQRHGPQRRRRARRPTGHTADDRGRPPAAPARSPRHRPPNRLPRPTPPRPRPPPPNSLHWSVSCRWSVTCCVCRQVTLHRG